MFILITAYFDNAKFQLRINVSGTHYELWESVVKLQPDTLLASTHFHTYWDSRSALNPITYLTFINIKNKFLLCCLLSIDSVKLQSDQYQLS